VRKHGERRCNVEAGQLGGVSAGRWVTRPKRCENEPIHAETAGPSEAKGAGDIVEHAQPIRSDEQDRARLEGSNEVEVGQTLIQGREEPSGRFNDGGGQRVLIDPVTDGAEIDAKPRTRRGEVR